MDLHDITPVIAEVAKSYRYSKPPDILLVVQDLIEKLRRFIADLLKSLHISLPGFQANTRMVGDIMQLLLFGAAVLAIIGLIYLVWTRLTQLQAQADRAKRGQLPAHTELDSGDWRFEAERWAKNAEFKLACRALYFSMLKRLHEKSVLEFVPTRTNYEYWYALAHHRSIALHFRELANIVESSWFGNRTASLSDYDLCLAVLDKVEQEIDEVHQRSLETEKAGVA
jgi:hypothetical protein